VPAQVAGLLEPVAMPVDRQTRSEPQGRVLGRRAGPNIAPSLAHLAPLPPLDGVEADGPDAALLVALLAATLALGWLALWFRHRGDTASATAGGPDSGDAAGSRDERDSFDWEPPAPPWSNP
jgi:hypothetical protein